MQLDAKEKVLVAIYTEYQKDLPDMKSISADKLGLDVNVFYVALDKLENEGFIRGVSFQRSGRSFIPIIAWVDGCKMTRFGIDYVEERFAIEKVQSGQEKVKRILAKAAEWGWEQFKDFGAKVLAEIISKQISPDSTPQP